MTDKNVLPDTPVDVPMPPVQPTLGSREEGEIERLQRMERVGAALARQLSAAMADNIRLTQRLAKAVTMQPHELNALHEVILNATAFAGLIGGTDSNKLIACCNVVNQFIDRVEDRPLAMDEGAGDAMFSDATRHLRDEMGKLQAGAPSPVDGKR